MHSDASNCPPHKKNILTSVTFWSIMMLLVQAVGPPVEKVLDKGYVTYTDVWTIVQVLVTAGVGITGRYNIGDVYTPRGIPGADPPPPRIMDQRRQLGDGSHRR